MNVGAPFIVPLQEKAFFRAFEVQGELKPSGVGASYAEAEPPAS